MSLFIASLNSGSNGNCYYIGNDTDAVLIDAGIRCRETEKRMKRCGLPIKNVKAIFVSHEHTDHISGVATLSKKYSLPVYITNTTYKFSGLNIGQHLIVNFRPDEPVIIGGLSIIAFPKFHDASDPHSFIVTDNTVTAGVFTDIGRTCEQVIHHFKQCNAVFLEANYDDQMLTEGSYPIHIKKRIRGGNGHLSNAEALQLFIRHKPAGMSHVLLSHLSENNNRPDLAQQLFSPYAGTTEIIIASRYEETQVYEISNTGKNTKQVTPFTKQKQQQLSLF